MEGRSEVTADLAVLLEMAVTSQSIPS